MKKILTLILVVILSISMGVTNVWALEPAQDTSLELFTKNLIGTGATRDYYGTNFLEDIVCSYGENYGNEVCFAKSYVTVAARANIVGGGCPTINVALERKIGIAFFTVCSFNLPTDGVSRGMFSAQYVASSGTYRFTYTISSSSSDTVEVFLCAVPHDYY